MVEVSIQIVNYKTKKYLRKCLQDILEDLRNSVLTYEIRVLDNCSGDDLADLEGEFEADQIVAFHYSKRNLGFGAGHNLLAKKVRSKFILILNPDLEFLEEKTIERLIKVAEVSEEIKVVGPKLVGINGKVQVWDHGELRGFLSWVANNSGNAHWVERQEQCEVAWVSGAVFLIKRETFEKASGFDENFFLYKEEEDLCLRIRQAGGKILYAPDIKVKHYNSVVASKSKYMLASKLYYIRKHYNNPIKRSILGKLQKILYPKK